MKRQALLISILLVALIWSQPGLAEDRFRLAYFLTVDSHESAYEMQEHGLLFGADHPVVRPMGNSGRGKCEIRLAAIDGETGNLVLEIFSDDSSEFAANNPVYSVNVNFTLDGAHGEVKHNEDGLNLEFAYSVVRQ